MTKFWIRIGISFLIVFLSLATVWLIKVQQVSTSPTGSLILTIGSVTGLIVGTCLFLVILYQYAEATKEKKRKDEGRRFEEEFTKQLLEVKSIDEVKQVVDVYKDKSALAHALSNPKIDAASLAQKIIGAYSQRKVRDTVNYLIKIGKGYQALGVIIKHLIAHKKIHDYQAYILEKEIGYLMPKRDIIGLYEKA